MRSPTSLWIAYAKSSGVAPFGRLMTSPVRGKDEYFIGKEVHLDGIDELVWISDVALPLEQLPQPGELGVVWDRS